MKIYEKVRDAIHRLSTVLVWISGILLALMALLIFVDVIGRYIFNSPIKGASEVVQMMMVCVLYFGLAYSTYVRAHIRVDILINVFPKFVKEFILGVMELLVAAFAVLMCVQVYRQGVKMLGKGSTTDILKIRYFPFYFITSAGSLVLTLEFILDAVRYFIESHASRLEAKDKKEETT